MTEIRDLSASPCLSRRCAGATRDWNFYRVHASIEEHILRPGRWASAAAREYAQDCADRDYARLVDPTSASRPNPASADPPPPRGVTDADLDEILYHPGGTRTAWTASAVAPLCVVCHRGVDERLALGIVPPACAKCYAVKRLCAHASLQRETALQVWGWFSGWLPAEDSYKTAIDGLVRCIGQVISETREQEYSEIPLAATSPAAPAPASANASASATSAAPAPAPAPAAARAASPEPVPATPRVVLPLRVAREHARLLGSADSLPGGNFWGANVPECEQLLLATERGLWEPCYGALPNAVWEARYAGRTSRKVVLPRIAAIQSRRAGTSAGRSDGGCWVQVRRLQPFNPELLARPVPVYFYE